MNTQPPVLQTTGLTKRFGAAVALDSLDLEVAPGETVCLLGANGAGKTTTINLFLGFLEPSAGAALVDGVEVARDPAAARRKLGYVAEVVALYPTLTGAENLDFFAQLASERVDVASRDAILTRLRFPERAIDKPAGTYSKGMRQKLGLAIALMKQAKAILLDEPLSGLDPAAANDLVAVLRETAAGGTALLISTHDIFRAKDVSTRIGIMRHGRLLAMIDPATLSASELEAIYLTHMAERAV
ncbi:ABC transporter ATP-binding protein [Erythrobacter sp. T5W1-R]|uniref:ABC transporter ATP-binding protein n=1 Tax=Erythrobacter sp. T5W1-R TaxID=3101752 RepID=UPI002AFE0E70|nr:ABC transporter ATP-binding protein [Erythrobacter sp. T5W1-R]MEA1619403.1 ABC transporter ATP-binding protein [Erythrobacter sp. T5W1-R]